MDENKKPMMTNRESIVASLIEGKIIDAVEGVA